MSDFAIVLKPSTLNPDLGDLELDPTGSEILLTDHPSQPLGRAVMQDLFIRLRFFYGEWFLNRTLGIPYFRYVFVKNPDLRLIGSIFRRVILGTPGIAALDKFDLRFDRPTRMLYPTFSGRLSTGQTFSSADFGELILTV